MVDCNDSDPEQRLECQDNVMFNRITMGTAIGAVSGAVLGGALGFALGGGRGIVVGATGGGIVGGVGGGLIAYLKSKEERFAGDMSRIQADIIADMHNDNRRLEQLVETSAQVAEKDAQRLADVQKAMKAMQERTDKSEEQIRQLQHELDIVQKNQMWRNQRINTLIEVDSTYTQAVERVNARDNPESQKEIARLRNKIGQLETEKKRIGNKCQKTEGEYQKLLRAFAAETG